MSKEPTNSHLADGGYIWIPATYKDDPALEKQYLNTRAGIFMVWGIVLFLTFCSTWSTLKAPELVVITSVGAFVNSLLEGLGSYFSKFIISMDK